MPLSSLFLNNFVILSYLFSYNIRLGVLIMLSLLFVFIALMQELYMFKDSSRINPDTACIMDISGRTFGWMSLLAGLLLVAFVNPLWFIGGRDVCALYQFAAGIFLAVWCQELSCL